MYDYGSLNSWASEIREHFEDYDLTENEVEDVVSYIIEALHIEMINLIDERIERLGLED